MDMSTFALQQKQLQPGLTLRFYFQQPPDMRPLMYGNLWLLLEHTHWATLVPNGNYVVVQLNLVTIRMKPV